MMVNILKTLKNNFSNKHMYYPWFRVEYIVVSVVIVLLLWTLNLRKLNSVYGIVNESLSLKHLKSYRINPNIFKHLETKSKITSKWATNVLLLYAITNEKTVKLMQVYRLLSASKNSLAETRSNNSGRYALLKSHIPCCAGHTSSGVLW